MSQAAIESQPNAELVRSRALLDESRRVRQQCAAVLARSRQLTTHATALMVRSNRESELSPPLEGRASLILIESLVTLLVEANVVGRQEVLAAISGAIQAAQLARPGFGGVVVDASASILLNAIKQRLGGSLRDCVYL